MIDGQKNNDRRLTLSVVCGILHKKTKYKSLKKTIIFGSDCMEFAYQAE